MADFANISEIRYDTLEWEATKKHHTVDQTGSSNKQTRTKQKFVMPNHFHVAAKKTIWGCP